MVELSLDSLRNGDTVITADSAGYFVENCKVCLYAQNHRSGVIVPVEYDDKTFKFSVTWHGDITAAMLRAWLREDKRNTEIAAIALTMLILPQITDYRAVESAGYGTGMDFILVTGTNDDTLIFNDISAYLEITGIAKETSTNTMADRIAEKKARINKVRAKDANILGSLPTLIVCVEFSKPLVKVVTND